MSYLRRQRKAATCRYHIYPSDVEYNGFSYLGPALVDGHPVNLNHKTLADAQAALKILHTDTSKCDWLIYDFITGKQAK